MEEIDTIYTIQIYTNIIHANQQQQTGGIEKYANVQALYNCKRILEKEKHRTFHLKNFHRTEPCVYKRARPSRQRVIKNSVCLG